MHLFKKTADLGACAWCGAYGNSAHRWNCESRPDLGVRLEPSRRAARDRRTSWAIREKRRIDCELVRDL